MDTIATVLASPIFLLDIAIHFLQKLFLGTKEGSPSPAKNSLRSFPRGTANETRGAPRSSTEKDLQDNFHGSKTVYEMIQASVQKFGDTQVAMESRKFIRVEKMKPTDKFPTKVFDDDKGLDQITYKGFGEKLVNFGKGLREIGMCPIPTNHDPNKFDDLKGDFKMVIFEATCPNWTIAMQGALSQSMVVGTCYATLGHDAVVAAVQELEASAILVNWKDVETFAGRRKEMPSLKAIIASTYEMTSDAVIPQSSKDLCIISSDDLMKLGQSSKFDVVPPRPSDVAVVMYTSGSTGKAKGVVMRHSQLVAGIAGMATHVILRPGKERFVSYLPLAHILALQVETVLLGVGATLSYSDPRELATSLSLFKPTIFGGVPKVYEILRNGLEKKLKKGPKALKLIYDTLLPWKMWVLDHGGDTPVSNLFFGLLAKKLFGGPQLRFGVTGGGPISKSLHLFARACFNCSVLQGYALTETCVGGCFQTRDDDRCGVVGPPVPCVEIMLQSEPEICDSEGKPYLHSDRVGSKGEIIMGRGEICFRGPSISVGYYKNTEKTNEAYDSEGFFHSGDIGQFTEDGAIQIVDRKKNLVKLKSGEYVGLESMEVAFAGSPYVTALCVLANGDMDGPMVVVCVDVENLQAWAAALGMDTNPKALGESAAAKKEAIASMVEHGRMAGLNKLELRIKDCCLLTTAEWKPGHGFTASMKLDRRGVHRIHAEEIRAMYERNGIAYTN